MYEMIIRGPAKNFIRNLDDKIKKEILELLELLKKNPRIGKPLVKPLKGLWSFSYPPYRIIYKIKDMELIVEALDIGHRKNIYDRKTLK